MGIGKVHSFNREVLEKQTVIIEKVVSVEIHPIFITADAYLTHFGGNGAFKFHIDGVSYISNLNQIYCKPQDMIVTDYNGVTITCPSNELYWMEGINFIGTQPTREEWMNQYIKDGRSAYWVSVK